MPQLFGHRSDNGDPEDLLEGYEIEDELDSTHEQSMGNAITNELIRSYGFKYTQEGKVEWSLENIAQSFKDEPFWTTLDWALIAAGPAKLATAARSVSKGVGVVGKAYQGGEFAGRSASTLVGKGAQALGASGERIAAAEAFGKGPGRLGGGYFRNPISVELDEDYLKWAETYGTEVWEKRGVARHFSRERRLSQSVARQTTEDLIGKWGKAGIAPEQMARGVRFLEKGISPEERVGEFREAAGATARRVGGEAGEKIARAADENIIGVDRDYLVRTLGSEQAADAYEATWSYRNALHEKMFANNLISEEAYTRNLAQYAPRLYEEYISIQKGNAALRDTVGKTASGTGMKPNEVARMTGRTGDKHDNLSRILDPRIELSAMMDAHSLVAGQEFASAIGKSVVARTEDDVLGMVQDIMGGDLGLAAVNGITPATVKAIRVQQANLAKVGKEMDNEQVLDMLGWNRLDKLWNKAGKADPAFLSRLPDELKGKYIDPAVRDEVMGQFEWINDPKWLKRSYDNFVGSFRFGKTAGNIATHFRNYFGASVFHHITTGGVLGAPKLFPRRGIQSIKKQDELYRGFVERGIGGTSFDAEVREHVIKAGLGVDAKGGQLTSLDWIGEAAQKYLPKAGAAGERTLSALAPAGKAAQVGTAKLEQIYRNTDEIWKLDAFAEQTSKYVKQGKSKKMAMDLAAKDVMKFMPQFSEHSDFGNLMRKGIPFASFTTEAVRNWSNAMTEVPHRAFMWNHVAEVMSSAFGAMAGFSQEELQAATEGLPNYMENKKLMAIPAKVNGKPFFVDLSYMIPMANLVEMERGDTLFFDELYSPAANPAFSVAAAATTGIDPFTQRKISPRITEQQLGIPVTGEKTRRVVGLGEYMLRTALPPLIPPGAAGMNLIEYARGTVNPTTGEKAEDGLVRTVLANIMGIRGYQPTLESQISNVKNDARENTRQVSQAWKRWTSAQSSGNESGMEREKQRIIKLKKAVGHSNPEKYFAKQAPGHEAGAFAGLSTKQLKEILARGERIGQLTDREQALKDELARRLSKRRNR